MRFDDIFDVLGGIVIVALATAIFSGRKTPAVIDAMSDGFQGSIKAALGPVG
jgi:hypothetical protein